MHFLKDAIEASTLVVRGRCNACSFSRNLWAAELGTATEETLPCDHRSQGCRGFLRTAYAGPKGTMPEHFHQPCSCHVPAVPVEVKLLCDMGFSPEAAQQALARGGSLEAALDSLTASSGGAAARGSGAAASTSAMASAAASATASAATLPRGLDACSICTEELLLSDAAMRCAGIGGKRHYFHATCLSQWIRQCRANSVEPTCPECRGPLQVRRGRLRDLLEGPTGHKLRTEDAEVLRDMRASAAEGADVDGWSDLPVGALLRGTAMVAGAAIAGLAIAAAIGAFSGRRRRESSHEGR